MKTATCSRWHLLLLFLLFHSFSFAQNKFKVTGKVVDNTGKPVDGATVKVKGVSISTITKPDGTFELNAPSGNADLVVTNVGFTDQTIALGGKNVITITMATSAGALDDVVVVGYGTRKKSDVTGAVASVSGEKLRTVPTTNTSQALQGRITGLEVTANSFQPGQGSRIRVRGNRSLGASNEPLYVVDGFPVSYTIDDINPTDIESIDVLKDASATAIYGVRGANGVIQITTKKGKAGKISMDYQGSQSVESILRKVPVFNSQQLTDAWRQAYFTDKQYTANLGTASATNPLYYFPNAAVDAKLFYENANQNQWNSIKDAYQFTTFDPGTHTYIARKRVATADEKSLMQNLGISVLDSLDDYDPSKLKSYDWGSQGLRNGMTAQHSINLSAGSDKFKTSMSLGYFNQRGIEYGQDYSRYSASNSNEFKPNKSIVFGSSINYVYSIQNTSTSSYGNALGMIPMAPAYDSAGNYLLFPNADQQIISAINDRNTVFDNTKVNRIFGNIYGEVTLFKGLKYRAMFGLDSRTADRGTFNGAQSSVRLGSPANASYTTTTGSSFVFDNLITYSAKIKSDHSINVTLLYELQSLNRTNSVTLSAQNLIFESQKWYSLQNNTSAVVTGSGTYSASQYLSYMGRLEYGFKNKYLLTVSNRYDNSSVLAAGKKGSYFPSASVAWRIDNESFFAKQNILTSAKLRAGIGRVGNSSIDPYQTNGPLTFTNYNWLGGLAAIGLAPATFPVPNLGWEKTTTTNAGIDFAFLKGRISGTVDVYSSSTTDMLQKQTVPGANGVSYILVNLGRVANRGVEVQLSTVNVTSRHGVTWTTDFIFSRNKEMIKDIDGSGNSNYGNLWILGQPIQTYYNYKTQGIFQYSDTAKGGVLADYYYRKAGNSANTALRPGKIRIQDTNGDTLLNASDKVVLGSANADFTGSIGNTISFKNFDLNFLVYFRVGGLYRVPRPGLVGRYQSSYANYWTPQNPSNDYQQPTRTTDVPVFWEALSYRSATYARVKNISLTYHVPNEILSKYHVANLSIYFNAVNPFLFHKKSPYDPEAAPYKESFISNTSQVGNTSYSYKSFVAGIRLGF